MSIGMLESSGISEGVRRRHIGIFTQEAIGGLAETSGALGRALRQSGRCYMGIDTRDRPWKT